MLSEHLAMERSVRRRSSLRRGSHAGDVQAVAVRRGRIRATMMHGEDNVEERRHGGALVSSGLDEAPIMAAVTGLANGPSRWLE